MYDEDYSELVSQIDEAISTVDRITEYTSGNRRLHASNPFVANPAQTVVEINEQQAVTATENSLKQIEPEVTKGGRIVRRRRKWESTWVQGERSSHAAHAEEEEECRSSRKKRKRRKRKHVASDFDRHQYEDREEPGWTYPEYYSLGFILTEIYETLSVHNTILQRLLENDNRRKNARYNHCWTCCRRRHTFTNKRKYRNGNCKSFCCGKEDIY